MSRAWPFEAFVHSYELQKAKIFSKCLLALDGFLTLLDYESRAEIYSKALS